MKNQKYYDNPENIIFLNPLDRFLSKIFGAKRIAVKCKVCEKYPVEVYGEYCYEHNPN